MSSTTPQVSDWKCKDMTPVLEGEFAIAADLMPSVLQPQSCSFILKNVNVALASGIRRAIVSENPVSQITFNYEDFSTDDPFCDLPDFVETRIRSIPIKQSVKPNATFELNFINNTGMQVIVTSKEIKMTSSGKEDLFDETIPIVDLAPGRFIKISNIRVATGYGLEHGTFVMTNGVICEPLDVIPYNMYTGEGVSSSLSDPRKHRITFETDGTMEPKKIVKLAISEIILRLKKISGLIYTITPVDNYFKLIIVGENDTTGNIIVKCVLDIYPDIEAITYKVDHKNKRLTLSIRVNDHTEAHDRISMGIKHAMDKLETISSNL